MTTLKLPRSAAEPRAAQADGETVTAERDTQDENEDNKRSEAPLTGRAHGGALEGDGSFAAAERYDSATKASAQSHDVEAAAGEAEASSPAEAEQLMNTEDKGRSRSRSEDGQTPRRRGRFLRRRR